MSIATLSLLALTLTGQVVELRSDRAFVTGQDRARIEIAVVDGAGRPVRDASVLLTVNVGSITEPVAEGEGRFRATYQPPAGEAAQVALFHAAVKRGAEHTSGWLSLPVHGRHLLRVPAPPRARVQVSIEGASFGPVTAESRGGASVPVTVPPGVTSARATITERSGKTRTQAVPLPPSRFVRVRLVAPAETSAEARPVRLQGFAVDESGRPAVPLPPLAVSVDRGALGPIEAREGGLFEVPYTAPGQAGGPVLASAAPLADPERPFTLQFEPPVPGTRTPVSPPSEGSAVAASDPRAPGARGARWQPSVGALLFVQSNTALSNSLGLQAEGTLRLAELPLEALLLVELRRNKEETQLHTSTGSGSLNKAFSLWGLGARLGARWSQPLWSRGVLFADASAGVLRMTGEVRLVDQDVPAQRLQSFGMALSAGGGLGWAMGPGRLNGQVHWAHAPGRGTVRGNLGGLSAGVGYQLPLGGVGP